MNIRRHLRYLAASLALACVGIAAEVVPPAPAKYFNDYAGIVSSATAGVLNAKLEDFERTTSCQVVVAVFPRMQSDSSLEDYTHRLATAWKIGQKDRNNGVGLFVFMQERRMRIEVGYGLEGALPDALAKRIIEDEIKPFFKRGDYAGGLSAGVEAILKATRGEYQGTGHTVAQGIAQDISNWVLDSAIKTVVMIALGLVIFIAIIKSSRQPRGTIYRSGGSSYWGGSSWGSGGSDWGGGGFSGGGFSGGGGSFGGGGASGSW